ncbi:acyl carrier protein [Pseudomonas sp. 3296]|jgi:acyl carrier protein|uniref:DUF1493 family protein n=1 Tax=Pseudomonas sp. 3296 TaxID=2817753 RepID=UPI002857CE4E|nr:DUF1493 family protein [Pseudomonas sp. 3296]MDR6913431.1 acyl carrier protein [Pseudomonas sp. 3296]MDR6919068.1 acyl carrier protein [Pseudomonas sp. 3296]
MTISLQNIKSFIAEATAMKVDHILDDSDLYADLGIDGDDFLELIEMFRTNFSVDMSEYRWYFHHREEGFLNFGALIFPPPYRRVKRMVITPKILHHAVETGSWPYHYPAHSLDLRRLDMLLNRMCLGILFLFGMGALVMTVL